MLRRNRVVAPLRPQGTPSSTFDALDPEGPPDVFMEASASGSQATAPGTPSRGLSTSDTMNGSRGCQHRAIETSPLYVEATDSLKRRRIDEDTSDRFVGHSIFMCECEFSNAHMVSDFVQRNRMSHYQRVPGGRRPFRTMTDESILITTGILNLLKASHLENICYNGEFSLENLYLMKDSVIKVHSVAYESASQSGIDLDYNRAALLIDRDIFWEHFMNRSNAPRSIVELLKVMRHNPYADQELIWGHVSVQRARMRVSIFTWQFENFKLMKHLDHAKYCRIHRCIDSWLIANYKSLCWKDRVRNNKYLKKILRFKNKGTRRRTVYAETGEGLLYFVRNGIQHLLENAIDFSGLTLKFHDYEINHIISGTFKGLLEAFQSAMFDEGELFKV